MDQSIAQVFTSAAILQMSGLIGLALFFIVIGWREARDQNAMGLFFLALAIFLILGHLVQLADLPTSGPLRTPLGHIDIWTWLAVFLTPALIALYILRGLVGLAGSALREGLVKLFFGLTLLCYIYMIGCDWPIDVKAIITVIWLLMFFKLELGELRA
jgi:hypothetical protein